MKNMFKLNILLAGLTITVGLNSCQTDDESPINTPVTSTTELTSKLVTTAPIMDGEIDAVWDACDKLANTAEVPNLANDFAYYVGEKYDFTLRSMYDANNIYFLVEYTDPTESVDRQSWYFDATAKLWKQQNKKPKAENDKFYEDKFAFLWPTATTASNWNSTTCYNTCHGVDKANGYDTENKHFTNSPNEVVDQWHYKLVRTGPGNQIDDQKQIYIDPANPIIENGEDQKKEGGRSSDAKAEGSTGGVKDNKQYYHIGASVDSVAIPLYVIPGKTDYSVINQSEIDGGIAKKITSVDANGILTYDGGTIDPSMGGYEAATGTLRFPSVIFKGALDGSRGDIATFSNHIGSGWVIEIKRALTTSDLANDVQYDITKEYMFGFAIFENAAVAHGIMPGLKLKFE